MNVLATTSGNLPALATTLADRFWRDLLADPEDTIRWAAPALQAALPAIVAELEQATMPVPTEAAAGAAWTLLNSFPNHRLDDAKPWLRSAVNELGRCSDRGLPRVVGRVLSDRNYLPTIKELGGDVRAIMGDLWRALWHAQILRVELDKRAAAEAARAEAERQRAAERYAAIISAYQPEPVPSAEDLDFATWAARQALRLAQWIGWGDALLRGEAEALSFWRFAAVAGRAWRCPALDATAVLALVDQAQRDPGGAAAKLAERADLPLRLGGDVQAPEWRPVHDAIATAFASLAPPPPPAPPVVLPPATARRDHPAAAAPTQPTPGVHGVEMGPECSSAVRMISPAWVDAMGSPAWVDAVQQATLAWRRRKA